ncbi:CPBP family intramembrane glutamic endopeptidase [Robiginitalea sediminis]|uniref:CPBP family intramembrane glutamic endopeptidase n=1 Tax=Robiginitalea sediminis TaxID=1982593 RepID=UPI001303435E|nr:CPBP family intramembrane glutamic endopeptidase [Robiginitalea sediminis]
MERSSIKEATLFSTLVLVLSALICYAGFSSGNKNLSILSVFTPSLVALILTAKASGRKGLHALFIQQTFRRTHLLWLLLCLLGIPMLAALAVLTELGFDLSHFQLRTTQILPQSAVIILIALGEEYGWRGYLFPKLRQRFNVLLSGILVGLVWGLWHFPAYLIGTGVPLDMEFPVFLLWVLLASIVIGWIYSRTESVLTSILVHIGANAAFNYLQLLPEFTGSMHTFWIFLLYMAILTGLLYSLRRKDFK